MIINTALTASLAVGADKSTPEVGDDNTVVPASISPIEKLLVPHHVLVAGAGAIARTSFVTFFEKLRAASTGPSADVIVTLTRGLWTMTWNLTARFQLSSATVDAYDIKFLIAYESDTQVISGIHGLSTLNQFHSGTQRFLLGGDADLRLDIVATGVSDAINALVCLNLEKNI